MFFFQLCNIYLFTPKAKEEKGQKQAPDETDHCGDKHSVRDCECEGVGLWHDLSGALLSVHPQPLQQAPN